MSLTIFTESTGRDCASLFIWGRNFWRHPWIIWNFLCVRIIVCGEQGIRNVGNIVNRIDNRTDLLHIRNLGIRSADEIMTALMEYQYSLLSDEGKKKYLARIEELNGKNNK